MKLRIKEARAHYEAVTGLKMTQKRLAQLVYGDKEISILTAMDYLNRLQRGTPHPNIETIEKIALITNTDYNFLINDKNQKSCQDRIPN
jgi:transcriptional regulator with XRE-family HTH domain